MYINNMGGLYVGFFNDFLRPLGVRCISVDDVKYKQNKERDVREIRLKRLKSPDGCTYLPDYEPLSEILIEAFNTANLPQEVGDIVYPEDGLEVKFFFIG